MDEQDPIDLERQVADWRAIEALLDRYDGEFDLGVASLTGWSGRLRLTLTNPELWVSRSIVFFRVGLPEEIVRDLLVEVEAYLDENAEPLEPIHP